MLQGELAGAARHELEDHLDGCPMCAQLMVELAQIFFPSDEEEDDGAPSERLDHIEHYQVRGILGKGGMGAVYEAFDTELERKVALKLLRADMVEPTQRAAYSQRMWREARVLASLNHPNVLTVHDVGQWRDQVYIVTELIDGQTLGQWLEQEQPHWRQIIEVFVQAGRGLEAAHEAGLIHRDVKLENLMMTRQGRVVVMDFGLARMTIEPDPVRFDAETARLSQAAPQRPPKPGAALTLTGSGVIMGTPAYMSPEQHLGGVIDARTDQFSWAVALFEAIYNERPFRGDSLNALMLAVCSGKIIPEPQGFDAPPALYPLLCRALEPDAADRFERFDELISKVAALTSEEVSAAENEGKPATLSAPRWLIAAIVLVVGVGASVLIMSKLNQPEANPTPQPELRPEPPVAVTPSTPDPAIAELGQRLATREGSALALSMMVTAQRLSAAQQELEQGAARQDDTSGRPPDHDTPSSPPQRKPKNPKTPKVLPGHQIVYENTVDTLDKSALAVAAWQAGQQAKKEGRWADCVKYITRATRVDLGMNHSYKSLGLPIKAECLFELKRCDEAKAALVAYEVATKQPDKMKFWGELKTKEHCGAPPSP